MDRILDGLNDHQKTAVTSTARVLQVLAPPGSGKTKTLTARVAYLIEHDGLKPWNIIVCTFTIKAAREMKERIRGFIGEELQKKLVLGTFHSIARRYLARYGYMIGVDKDFGIADSNDSRAIIARIIKRDKHVIDPKEAGNRISRRKSRMEEAVQAKGPKAAEAQQFEELYQTYEATLKSSNILDYDDLLLKCVELLRKCPECAANIQAVLVDEFQDTNTVQYELMRLFAQTLGPGRRKPPLVTIVGDPDQSIYSFRSAEIENLARMRRYYQDTQVVNLTQNYRSAGWILKFAMRVIEQDDTRPQKSMQSTHGLGTLPVLRELETPAQEATWLVREVKRLMSLSCGILNYSDFAILLRSSPLSKAFELELGREGVPYYMHGGRKFFERMEVRILLDYMRVISQPSHTDAMLRIINTPPRRIGDPTIKSLVNEAEQKGWNLWQLITKIVRNDYKTQEKVPSMAEKGLADFYNVVARGRIKVENLDPAEDTLVQLLEYIEQAIPFKSFLESQRKDKESLETSWENVNELKTHAATVPICGGPDDEEDLVTVEGVDQAVSESGPQLALAQFLKNVALATDQQTLTEQEEKSLLTISTMHAAKGLEWPVVFIPAVYHGSIPHSRNENDDEERRLLYVGMTRAQGMLYLSWPLENAQKNTSTLSKFLTHEEQWKKYETKGPSFNLLVAEALAKVLGRQCPSADELISAYTASQFPEDVALIEKRNALDNVKFSKATMGCGNDRLTQSSGFISATTVAYMNAQSTSTTVASLQGQAHTTTEQRLNAGFMKASSIRVKPQPPASKPAAVSNGYRHPPRAYDQQDSSMTPTSAPMARQRPKPTKKVKQLAPSQSTIGNFFARKTIRPAELTPVSSTPVSSNTVSPDVECIQDALPEISSLYASNSHVSNASMLDERARHPKAIKSSDSALWNRSIRSTQSFTKRPRTADYEDTDVHTKHILLSSSPVKEPPTAILEPLVTPVVAAQQPDPRPVLAAINPRVGVKKRYGMGSMKSWSDIQKEKAKENRSASS